MRVLSCVALLLHGLAAVRLLHGEAEQTEQFPAALTTDELGIATEEPDYEDTLKNLVLPRSDAPRELLFKNVVIVDPLEISACATFRFGWRMCGILYLIMDPHTLRGLGMSSTPPAAGGCMGLDALNSFILKQSKRFVMKQISKQEVVKQVIHAVLESTVFIDASNVREQARSLVGTARSYGMASEYLLFIPGCIAVDVAVNRALTAESNKLSLSVTLEMIRRLAHEIILLVENCELCFDNLGLQPEQHATLTQELVSYLGLVLSISDSMEADASIADFIQRLADSVLNYSRSSDEHPLTNFYKRLELLNDTPNKRAINKLLKLQLHC